MTLQSNSTAVEQILLPNVRDVGGFDVRRALPSARRRMVGPFIFLDSFGPVVFGPGEGADTPPHPHIGLATVSYLLDGELLHRDSAGFVQQLLPGEINLMTAGRGIVHSERSNAQTRRDGGTLMGFQAWLALPEAVEESDPGLQHVAATDIPLLEGEGAALRLLAGSLEGRRAPTRVHSDLFYADLTLQASARYRLPAEHIERALYVVAGAVEVVGEPGTFAATAWWCYARTARWYCAPRVRPACCCSAASRSRDRGTSTGISSPAGPSASSRPRRTGAPGASRTCRGTTGSSRCRRRGRCACASDAIGSRS